MSRARRVKKMLKRERALETFTTSLSDVADHARLTAAALVEVSRNLEHLRVLAPRIVPSRFIPPGVSFEFEVEKLFGPVLELLPDGRVKREKERVLYVNADDYRKAIEG